MLVRKKLKEGTEQWKKSPAELWTELCREVTQEVGAMGVVLLGKEDNFKRYGPAFDKFRPSSSWSQSFLRKMLCFQCESKDAISQRVTVHRKAGETPKQHDCYRDEEEDDLRHQRKLGSQGLSSNGRSPGTTGTQGCQVGPVG